MCGTKSAFGSAETQIFHTFNCCFLDQTFEGTKLSGVDIKYIYLFRI